MRHFITIVSAVLCLLTVTTVPADALTLFEKGDTALTLDIDNITGVEWHHQHQFDTGSGVAFKSDDYVKLYDILDARLRVRNFQLGMRLEGQWYPDHLSLNRELANGDIISRQVSENDIRLEKLYLRHQSRRLTVDLGDYYVTFGRGLAISMRRDGEEIDQSLRGGKLMLRLGETDLIGFAGFSNTINVDPFHETPQADPWDLIGGFRIEQNLGKAVTLGAHVVGARYGALEPADRLRFIAENTTTIAGGSFEIPDIFGLATFYFEGNYMHRKGREVNDTLTGFREVSDNGAGLYSSLAFFVDNLTLTAEYKYYNDFIFRRGHTRLGYVLDQGEEPPEGLDFYEDIYYNNVPTLERTDIETNRTYGNDHGFRLRADYNISATQTLPYVALYFTVNKPFGQNATNLGGFGNANDFSGDRIWHVYGGVTQLIGPWEFVADGGFRDEYSWDQDERILRMGHAKLSSSVRVAPRHTLSAEVFYMHRDFERLQQVEDDVDLTLGYSFSSYLSISLLYTLQQKDFATGQGDDELNHFVAAEVRSNPTGWLEMSLFGGQVRESYRCFGGFCRLVPPFEGVKARVRIKF